MEVYTLDTYWRKSCQSSQCTTPTHKVIYFLIIGGGLSPIELCTNKRRSKDSLWRKGVIKRKVTSSKGLPQLYSLRKDITRCKDRSILQGGKNHTLEYHTSLQNVQLNDCGSEPQTSFFHENLYQSTAIVRECNLIVKGKWPDYVTRDTVLQVILYVRWKGLQILYRRTVPGFLMSKWYLLPVSMWSPSNLSFPLVSAVAGRSLVAG